MVLSGKTLRVGPWVSVCIGVLLFVGSAAPQTNLALNKPCTGVSFQGDDPQFGFGKAVDGDTATRWSTGDLETFEARNTAWWQVDLQDVHTINKVSILWEFAFGRSYDIEVSTDGSTWTTAKHIAWAAAFQTNDGLDEIYFEPVQARYVKYQGITRGSPYGHSFWEFRVYENAQVPANPPTFEYPGPTAAFTIEGGKCPCEIVNVGPVQYSPYMFHTNTNLINYEGGYSTIIYPGGDKVQWTYRWSMLNVGIIAINNMAGIWYGKPVQGGAPTDDEGILPLPVTADIHTTWKVNYSGVSGSYTVAYDIWTNYPHNEEIMIFLNKTGRYAYRSDPFTTVTLGGIEWTVSHSGNTAAFDPVNRPIYEVDINLKDFFKVLIEHGKLSSDRMVRGMWVGSETGGDDTWDRTEGTLTTTEWTISSPQASVSAWNRPPAGNRAPAASSPLSSHTVVGMSGARTHSAGLSRQAYTLRGELLDRQAIEAKRTTAGGVYIEHGLSDRATTKH